MQVGRLAMRVEGDFWVAYYALPDTMEGALFLGSIRMAFVQDIAAKETFMALMRDAVSDIVKGHTGIAPEWPDPHGTPAPEHERAGRT
ncbi:hypothetical protein D9R08_12015 [Rhodophyticola porphyridii]|uniref:Uncharacterized protein n=2 Tax=Rhodophyticola porphyridii TaxID=1852017 RepID=A0A3L9Y7D2_9RHOB|nr:hypothetical protein D9R08_12015 [Rhodophyticola porphyridii]